MNEAIERYLHPEERELNRRRHFPARYQTPSEPSRMTFIFSDPVRQPDIRKRRTLVFPVVNITDTEQFNASIAGFTDVRGNAANVQGAPTWESSDPSLVTVEPTPDGLGATLKAVGPLGQVDIQLVAQAIRDDGSGTDDLNGGFSVAVGPSEATGIAFQFEAPTEQGVI